MKEDYEDQLDFISDYIRVRKGKLLGKIIDVEYLKNYETQFDSFDAQLQKIKNDVDGIIPFAEMEVMEEDSDNAGLEELEIE